MTELSTQPYEQRTGQGEIGSRLHGTLRGFRSMAAPTRELEKLIVSQKLAHGDNPVTRWMDANVWPC
jgi:phage terminase large subunit-like protein